MPYSHARNCRAPLRVSPRILTFGLVMLVPVTWAFDPMWLRFLLGAIAGWMTSTALEISGTTVALQVGLAQIAITTNCPCLELLIPLMLVQFVSISSCASVLAAVFAWWAGNVVRISVCVAWFASSRSVFETADETGYWVFAAFATSPLIIATGKRLRRRFSAPDPVRSLSTAAQGAASQVSL